MKTQKILDAISSFIHISIKKISIFSQKISLIIVPRTKQLLNYLYLSGEKVLSIFSKKEKIAFLVLILIIILNNFLLYRSKHQVNFALEADFGGTYTEGIIGQKAIDVQQVTDKLTKVGLVRFDNDGKIEPDLAESWDISNDGKQYIFHLRTFVKAKDLADILKVKSGFQDLKIESSDDKTLNITLPQIYSPLLASLSEPIFTFGPYIIEKEDKNEVRLKVRKNFYLGSPNIETIVLKIYSTQDELNQALNQKEIDGLSQISGDWSKKGYNLFKMALPRWQVLFFNLNNEQLKNKELRKKISRGEKLDNPLELTFVTSSKSPYPEKAYQLKDKWSPLGLNLNVVLRDPTEIQKQIIPNRDYNMLLYGLNYGRDPDPYPFWHSTQISEEGLNLSSFANVDADKILEEARATLDDSKRKELYERFQKILDEETPVLVLDQTIWQYVVSSKIKGSVEHSGFNPCDRFNEVWKWYIKTKKSK